MSAKVFGIATAAVGLVAALAQAQGPGGGPERGPGGRPGFGPPRGQFGPPPGFVAGERPEGRPMPPRPPPLFGILDLNNDGVLDDHEIREAPDSLRKLDRDGDGKVSIRECFGAPDRQPGGPEAGPRGPRGDRERPEGEGRPRGPRDREEPRERRGPHGEGGDQPRPARPPAE
ncbi:MAG: hypothetical protein N2652_02040 [Kiritimatiellae bacterium]|nr:hypothetical protein [Kiritimatiellia bacterium]